MNEISSLQQDPVALPGRPFGLVARSVAGYAVLMAVMFVSPLFVFLPAAIFHCSIRNGRRSGAFALALATLIGAVLAFQTGRTPSSLPSDALMGYAYLAALVLAIGVPALIVLPLVERAEAFGRVVLVAVLSGIVGLAITETAMRAAAGFSPYREQVIRARQTAAQFVVAYQKAGMPADAVSILRRWMEAGISCLPAFFLIDIVIVFVLSLVMFGRLKSWRQVVARSEGAAPVAPAYLFRNLSLPDWLLFAFVIGGLTPLASGLLQKVTANMLAVVVFLYLLQGLAIFRSLLAAVGVGFGGVMFGYLVLAFLTITGIAPLLLSIAGLFDSFFDFRHFRRKDHSDESHPH